MPLIIYQFQKPKHHVAFAYQPFDASGALVKSKAFYFSYREHPKLGFRLKSFDRDFHSSSREDTSLTSQDLVKIVLPLVGEPDCNSGLNKEAIEDWWENFTKNEPEYCEPDYSFKIIGCCFFLPTSNCSSHIYKMLEAAGAYDLVSHWHFIDRPADLMILATKLQQYLKTENPNASVEFKLLPQYNWLPEHLLQHYNIPGEVVGNPVFFRH